MTEQTAIAARVTSPFKFLDSYAEQDRAAFFGRDEEIETLYRLMGESRLVLVYGASGTGKTSLIQCGLTSKFSPTSWLPVNVRRGDNLNDALLAALRALAITPLPADITVPDAVRSIYLDHLRPVFLIFDQFEELYVLGSKDEQDKFYAAVKELLGSDTSCRIIISLREEYLAALDRFELAVPSLFDKRLRVETMTNANVKKVIVGTAAAHDIVLEHGVDTARLIIAQLDDKRVGVQLAYLQVYLDHLYRTAATPGAGGAVTFTDAAIDQAGKLGDIMAGFLDAQEGALQAELEASGTGIAKGGIARLLDEFVTVTGTKQPSTTAEIAKLLPSSAGWLQQAVAGLQDCRLLRLVGDHYELAHDALATRIAERRSTERKDLLEIAKIVTDRREGFERTATYLTPEELAMVKLAQTQKDPVSGEPLFVLAAQDDTFIHTSRKRARRTRIVGWLKTIGWLMLGPVLALGLWIAAEVIFPSPPPPEEDRKFNAVDREVSVMLGTLINQGQTPDETVDLLNQVSGNDAKFPSYSEFSEALRAIDVDAIKSVSGFEANYDWLEQKVAEPLAMPVAADIDWVQAKTVLWHRFWFAKKQDRINYAVPLLKRMLDPRVPLASINPDDKLIHEVTGLPEGFLLDASLVCNTLENDFEINKGGHDELKKLCAFNFPPDPAASDAAPVPEPTG